MRILFLSNFYPPFEMGGYEQLCKEVATRLIGRGHDIAVLTSRYGAGPARKKSEEGITRSLYLQTDVAYYRPFDFFFRRAHRERANIGELRSAIRRFRPDVIAVWGMWNLSHNLPFWAEQWMPGRVAYFISSYWPMDADPHTAYWRLPARHSSMELLKRPLRALALRRLRSEKYPPKLQLGHALCCSAYVRDTLVRAGKLPEHAGVLPVGIDPEPFLQPANLREVNPHDAPKTLELLYFGRLIRDKGVHTALEALGLLKRQGLVNDIRLTILGSGHPDYERELRQLVAQLQIGEQVEFAGHVNRDRIPGWLSNFDAFLFTSIWHEPLARTVMEAMAAGLLVIGTEVGGQTEMLSSGVDSLTFQAGDAESLARQILRIRHDWPLRISLGRAGQRLILAQYTLERMVHGFERYLLDLVQAAPRP